MSIVAIRIVGGICGAFIGTYFSGKIHDYLNNKKEIKDITKINKTKEIKDVKSFEELLNLEIDRQIIKQPNDKINDTSYFDLYTDLFSSNDN